MSPQGPNSQPQIQTGSTVPMHACAACHQVFPENMMSAVGPRWVCLLCKERALDDPMAAERAKYRMSPGVPNYTVWIVAISILGWVGFFGIRMFISDARSNGRQSLVVPAPVKVVQAAAPWASKPPAEWPALVAPSTATFKAGIFRAAPQATFVQSDDGALLALTTVGLGLDAKPKEDEITPERLQEDLEAWTVGSGDQALKITQTRASEDAFMEGVVVLAAPEGAKPPIAPITLRKNDYRAGAPAFAVVRNAEGGQTVYRGSIMDNASADGSAMVTQWTIGRQKIVTETGNGSATRVHFDQAIKVSEMRGAALVDSDGLLMAIITVPVADVGGDTKTKTFLAFGMTALQETVNFQSSKKRPMERAVKK